MRLKKLEVNSFAGINPNSPVVIDFTESKFIVASGDQGLGKTSLLNSLLVACGALSKDNKDFINNDTGKIDVNFEFVGKDRCNYAVRCTKSKFELTYEGEAVAEPISKMKELLGVVGISPMSIKDKPLKEIVKWLSTYSTKNIDEFEKELAKHKDNRKKAMDTRASANKSYKALKETLENDPMYNDWEGSEKVYEKEVDIQQLSKQLQEAGNKSDKYIRAEERVKSLKNDRPNIVSRIEQLRQQLLNSENALAEQDTAITTGEQYLADNKQDKTNYDVIKKKYDTAAQDIVNYNNWQTVKQKKGEMDEYETISQQADSTEKDIAQKMKDLQAEILPDIKGMQLITEDTIEDGVTYKEGLYRDGKNVRQLSESEWVDTVFEIWRKYKVKVVVLDNIGTLGSEAIERLQKLSKDGCYILAAEMNREQKSLSISYE